MELTGLIGKDVTDVICAIPAFERELVTGEGAG